mmetsp:Transcript_13704/g.18518  ORF Transcript_13704/g.18518 Transcript_13704/m.18518 type:complete len:91 (-) Transcript_13704:713-985(-)
MRVRCQSYSVDDSGKHEMHITHGVDAKESPSDGSEHPHCPDHACKRNTVSSRSSSPSVLHALLSRSRRERKMLACPHPSGEVHSAPCGAA